MKMDGAGWRGVWVIARATRGEVVRRAFYLILLGVAAVLIFLSQYLTLFAFAQEIQMVREMGVATLSLWGFLVLVVSGALSITSELEDRTAVLLLSKPLGRTGFLLGKYVGILRALAEGLFFLSLVLLLTLWWGFGRNVLGRPAVVEEMLRGAGPWGAIWNGFLREGLLFALQAFGMCLLQMAVLGSICISLSAFSPPVVTVAGTTLLYLVGNVLGYMVGSVERLGVPTLTASVHAISYVLPNLGYFTLPTHFSEGRIVSASYAAAAAGYAALYSSVVFLISGARFERREIR